jgi:hypothetical protein
MNLLSAPWRRRLPLPRYSAGKGGVRGTLSHTLAPHISRVRPPHPRPSPPVYRGRGELRGAAITAWLLIIALTPFAAAQEEIAPPPKVVKTKKKDDNTIRINGRLAASLPLDKKRTDSYSQVHTVKLKRDLEYVIEMRKATPSEGLDPYLRLEDSAGLNLAEDDDSGGNLAARINYTPPTDGEFRVIATSFGSRQEGDYELVIVGRPAGTPAPPPGTPIVVYTPVEFGDIVITPLAQHQAPTLGGADQSVLHGYTEHRFEIENRSAKVPHQVTLILPRHRSHNGWNTTLSALRKSVDVAPEATLVVSLFQPDVPISSASAEVIIDGVSQEREVSASGWRTQMNHRYFSGMYGRHTPSGPGRSGSVAVLAGADISQAINANVYKCSVGVKAEGSVPGGVPVRSGVFVEQGSPFNGQPFSYAGVHLIMAANTEALTTRSWLGFSAYDGVALSDRSIEAMPAETRAALWQAVECGGTLLVIGKTKLPESWRFSAGEIKGTTTATPGFGACLVIDNPNIARWSPAEWKAIVAMWDQSRAAWNQLTNITNAHAHFPVVENLGIPVRGLFSFMLVFVLLIGPINIYWLSRTNRRLWLLWTVPVFSLFTTGALFAFMAASEGWHAHVRGSGTTVLDELSQRATTIGWLGYYSPTTSRALHFSFDTELSPHLESEGRHYRDNTSRALTIDWTNDQHLDSGWLSAKVPLHFLVRRSEKRLERLPARREGDDIIVVNGLKADIKTLKLADKDGAIFSGENITAGAEGRLRRTNDKVEKSTSLHEKFSGSWVNLARELQTSDETLRAGTYIAALGDSPFLEQGLRETQSRKMEGVVYGILKEAP